MAFVKRLPLITYQSKCILYFYVDPLRSQVLEVMMFYMFCDFYFMFPLFIFLMLDLNQWILAAWSFGFLTKVITALKVTQSLIFNEYRIVKISFFCLTFRSTIFQSFWDGATFPGYLPVLWEH